MTSENSMHRIRGPNIYSMSLLRSCFFVKKSKTEWTSVQMWSYMFIIPTFMNTWYELTFWIWQLCRFGNALGELYYLDTCDHARLTGWECILDVANAQEKLFSWLFEPSPARLERYIVKSHWHHSYFLNTAQSTVRSRTTASLRNIFRFMSHSTDVLVTESQDFFLCLLFLSFINRTSVQCGLRCIS